jgi:phenylalanyl-tRNA synthetase beta chain
MRPLALRAQQIHGLVDRLMTIFGLERQAGVLAASAPAVVRGGCYSFMPSEHPSFLAGRQAQVFVNTLSPAGEQRGVRSIGHFGVLHPEVLGAFELPFPGSAMEFHLELLA